MTDSRPSDEPTDDRGAETRPTTTAEDASRRRAEPSTSRPCRRRAGPAPSRGRPSVEPERDDATPSRTSRALDRRADGDGATGRCRRGRGAEEPVSVGRMFADSIRRAGVRWAFTVPGESFLGLLEGLEAVGINVVATRHEGAAAFMAEAHAQLTGRPAACIGTRAVGGSNLAIGIHTAFSDSSPMFAFIGQVERSAAGPRGLPGDRRRRDDRPARQVVGRADRRRVGRAGRRRRGRPGAQRPPRPGGPRPSPRTSSTSRSRRTRRRTSRRVPPPRPTDDQVRDVLHLLAGAERPLILAGAGVLRARTSNDLVRLAELLRVPVVASWRRGDVISNDHPLYLGMTGYGSPATVRERARRRGCAARRSAAGSARSRPIGWTVPAAGTRWAHVDIAPGRRRAGPAAARR